MNYLGVMTAGNGALTVRPIGPTDVDRLERMFYRLSPTTVYRRFFSPIQEPPQRMLMWFTNVDHDRREALVAVHGNEIIAVARYDGRPGSAEAEIAVTVEDAWQHQGIGRRLARRLAASRARPRLRAVHRRHAPREPRGDRPLAPPLEGRPRAVHRRHLLGGGAAVTRADADQCGARCRARRRPVDGRGAGTRTAIRTTCRRPRTPCCRRDRWRGRHRARRSR